MWGGGKRFSLSIMCDIVAGEFRFWAKRKGFGQKERGKIDGREEGGCGN